MARNLDKISELDNEDEFKFIHSKSGSSLINKKRARISVKAKDFEEVEEIPVPDVVADIDHDGSEY